MTLFDPQVELDHWFVQSLGAPTPVQHAAWPVIRAGRHALLIASTGQGKSLAAWRPVVERMIDQRPEASGVRALHIAPLKALARDMTANLQPLLDAAAEVQGRPLEIALRCGDTSRTERQRQRRRPPAILSTTPESLFVLLGSRSGRRMLKTVETVVVDELHAIASSKRGAHLALSLARLDRLAGTSVQRIGLTATAHPAGSLARFLTGGTECEVVAPDRPAVVDLNIELPDMPLGAYPNTVHWAQIHQRITDLASPGGSLLVFCQTRAQVERSAAAVDELLAESGRPGQVGAHHGSLDPSHREKMEARFKRGELDILVSSASLELGLDLGLVDRVCQLGVPGSVNLVRQRAGRSGHRPGRRPCIHLFPLTLSQLAEAGALSDALAEGLIDSTPIPVAPLDVLAQHLVAMIAERRRTSAELLDLARSAWPWRDLGRETMESVLACLAEVPESMPFEQTRPMVWKDDRGWRAHAEADRLALTNAGTIPEFFEYDVVRVDSGKKVGTLDEEFAFESSPGQVMQLGRRSWRIVRVMTGQVRVEPADGEPAELPFWFGEGPGRTPEMADKMLNVISGQARQRLHPQAAIMLEESAARLGRLPSPNRLVIERFADPNGDRHVVLHTFAGARINRAWGLALRKRFCRQFNFELQAAATDDGILISLGVTSQFELADVVGFVRSHNVRDVLTQALLDTPLFVTRFRWCANNALVLLKNGPDGRIPAQRQRSQAENLIACVFPDQLACLENLSGPREVPDHPLVTQALGDCLHEYMDLDGLERLLAAIETGRIEVHAVDTPEPSRLAEALIHAPRYSYLDEAAAEERRTRNFESAAGRRLGRTTVAVGSEGNGRHLPAVSETGEERLVVRPELGASIRLEGLAPDSDVLESLLMSAGFLTAREGESGIGLGQPLPAGGWGRWFVQLVRERRATVVSCGQPQIRLWVAAERLDWLRALDPGLRFDELSGHRVGERQSLDPERIRRRLLAARRQVEGPSAETTMRRVFPLTAHASVLPAACPGRSGSG